MTTGLVFSGSGTGLAAQAGAYDALLNRGQLSDLKAVGGTSGGGLIALAIAAGHSPTHIRDELTRLLTRQDLRDLSLRPWDRFGLYKGDRIHAFLKDYFGGRKMNQLGLYARVTACRLETGRLRVFDRYDDVYVHDVARATMSIPLVFKAHPIQGATYVDGGVNANFALGLFDDLPWVTNVIGVRFQPATAKYDPKTVLGYAAAMFDLRQDAADAGHSVKPTRVLNIVSAGNRLDFALTEAEVRMRYFEGWMVARDAV